VPAARRLPDLAAAARKCEGCDLYLRATQVVFGEGSARAALMLVGEQPGDREDLEGKPFVGPAGALLTRALAEAGVDRATAYVTNAVKHFSWEERGKRRIHKKPRADQVRACRPWLEAEIETLSPRLLVCLGATAAQALLGAGFKLMATRGRILEDPGLGVRVLATIHPSAVLRAPDAEARKAAFESLVADLRVAAKAVADRL
jgi:DNA polymerase